MSKSAADARRADASTDTAALIRRHSLVTYFLLAFGISWVESPSSRGPSASRAARSW
jgi:hypothetical protein